MIIGFTPTYAASAYPIHGEVYSYNFRLLSLSVTWNIVESGGKHLNPSLIGVWTQIA
jgi:hypothetical protein